MSIKYVYAVKHKNEEIRAASRSGGIFTAISDVVLSAGGVVYGCVLNEQFEAIHIRAVTAEDRDRMRGSKYVQSRIGNCYKLCAQDLKNGVTVLFSGTPCQIDGLNCYLDTLKIDRSRLLTVEILCHAVASPKVWSKFLNYSTDGEKISSVDFRNKNSFGWNTRKTTIKVDNEIIVSEKFSDLYYRDLISPKKCYYCDNKSLNRIADITIGDYWGIDKLSNTFSDNKGVNLVIINTKKGGDYFNISSNDLITETYPLALSLQTVLYENYPMPPNRDEFFKDLDILPFDKLYDKYTRKSPPPKLSFKQKVKRRIFYYIEKVIMFGK